MFNHAESVAIKKTFSFCGKFLKQFIFFFFAEKVPTIELNMLLRARRESLKNHSKAMEINFVRYLKFVGPISQV